MREGITKYPMIPIVLSLAGGIFLSRYFRVFDLFGYGVILAICLVILLLLHRRLKSNAFQTNWSNLFYLFTLLLFFCVGGLVYGIYQKNPTDLPTGKVVATLSVTEKLKSNQYYNRYYAQGQTNKNERFKLLLYQSIELDAYDVGEELTGFFELRPIDAPRNPYGFDYRNYLSNLNVHYQTRIFTEENIISKSYHKNFYYQINQLRKKLIQSFDIHDFNNETHSVVVALLFGDTSELSDEVLLNYRNSGVMHVLAVSGLHVGILYFLLSTIFGFVSRNKFVRYILIAVFLIIFACLSGLSGSVVRAVVMFLLFGAGRLIYRNSSTINILAVSAFLMLIVYPAYLFDVGFQLSFLAVFSIVYLYPLMSPYIYQKNKIVAFVQSMLCVSLAAQIGVLPLSVYYFGQIPLLFLVGNLFAIPLSSAALILSVVLIPLNYVWKDLSVVIGFFVDGLLKINNFILNKISAFDEMVISGVPLSGWQCLLLSFAVFFIAYWLKNKKFWIMISVLCMMILFQLSFYFTHFSTKNIKEEILFYDTQQVIFSSLDNKVLHLYSNKAIEEKNYLNNYRNELNIRDESVAFEEFNRVFIADYRLLVVDSTAVYPKNQPFDYLLLYDNPNINLERCLSEIKPKKVIIHTKNARWKTKMWRETCIKKNIPFHDMREKGYVYLQK